MTSTEASNGNVGIILKFFLNLKVFNASSN